MALVEMDFTSGVGTKIITESFSQSTTGRDRTISTTTDFSVYDHVFAELTAEPVSGYTSFIVVTATQSNSITVTIGSVSVNSFHEGTYTLTGNIYAFND